MKNQRKSLKMEKNEKTHQSGPHALKMMLLWSVSLEMSLSQPYLPILTSEMECIDGKDVGTLLGLGCHWRRWESLR